MPIRFFCPFGHMLVVPDHRAGKKGRCPTCDQRVSIPSPTPMPLGGGGQPLLAGPQGPVRADPAPATMNLGFSPDETFEQWFGPLPGATPSPSADAPSAPAESSRLPALDLFGDAVPTSKTAPAPKPSAVEKKAEEKKADKKPYRPLADIDDLLGDIPDEPRG